MNAFQILDKDGKAINIKQLDVEVCEMIGVEVDPKWYCMLGKREDYPEGLKGECEFLNSTSDWYHTIGRMIADDGKSFQEIIDYYANVMKAYIGQTYQDGSIVTLESIYPYHTKVLNTWISKGYVAKQIINEQ